MEADSVRTPKRRPKTNYLDLGSPEPKPQTYSPRASAARNSAPNTDGYLVDEGYEDPPRTKTSSVRMGPTPTNSIPRPTQVPAANSVPRRQQAQQQQQPPTYDMPASPRSPRATRKIATTPPPEIEVARPDFFTRLKHMHWLFLIGLGMLAALVLWLAGSAVLAWGTQRYDDFRYGNPRTYQTDAVVNHGGDSTAHPSHFIAMHLGNKAVVIELKASDPSKIVSYEAPITIIDGGQAPVTVSFKDVNGDGKPDMIIDIHLPGQDQYSIFINDGDKFRPSTSNDVIHP